MQSANLGIYVKYRRLLILLLILPAYKLIQGISENDYVMVIAMIVALCIAISAIVYLESRLKAAPPPSPVKRPPATLK